MAGTLCRDLSIQDIYQILADMCEGLLDMHALGLSHHDVKGANVLLFLDHQTDGSVRVRAKIGDLGLAGPLEQTRGRAQR